MVIFSIPAFVFGYTGTGILDLGFATLYLVPILVTRVTRRGWVGAQLLCAFGLTHIGFAVVMTGGVPGLATVTVLLLPVAATLTMGSRTGWVWLAIGIAMLTALNATNTVVVDGIPLRPIDRGWAMLVMLATTGALIQAAVTSFSNQRRQAQRELAHTLQDLERRVVARTIELEVEVEQRRLAEERAAQANHAKTSFLMNMSHELRTPLNAIQGYAELVSEELADLGSGPAQFTQDLSQITGASRHLLSLIDNILEYARLEEGQLTLESQLVDVAALLDDTARMMQPVLVTRNNELVLDVVPPEEGDIMVWGDAGWVRQILINLVSNAHKFTEDGLITLHAHTEGDRTVLSVTDEGPGIEPELASRIFDRFTRGEGDQAPGTGLGLAISRDLARRMKGTLSVTSTVGEGSTFSLEMPCEPGADEERTLVTANELTS